MSVYKVIAIVVVLLATQNVSAQNELTFTPSGNEFTSKLIERKVDTIVVYNTTYFRRQDGKIVYIFWKKDGKTSVYDDRYGELDTISGEMAKELWSYFDANYEMMKSEKIKPFSYVTKVKGKMKVETPMVEDMAWVECNIYLNGQSKKFVLVENPFQAMMNYGNGRVDKNINYEYNNALKLKIFEKMVKDLIP